MDSTCLSEPQWSRIQAVLGYINLSTGRADPKFRKAFAELYEAVSRDAPDKPWLALRSLLQDSLARLRQTGSPVFADCSQVEAVLRYAFDLFPEAYRRHHADLLFHLSDADVYQPFFLVRVCEAVLRQQGPWDQQKRILDGALKELNDFVGYRPVPVLETRWTGEIYDGEKVCPIPLYFRGVGSAPGAYCRLVQIALDVLQRTDNAILSDAGFDLDALEELALDPRAYDHAHPANRRPNYVFGEWDPHRLDRHGRFCRFVVRDVILNSLLRYAEHGASHADAGSKEERLQEAGTVLAGTILMASAITGASPHAYDSTTTLSTLVPRIAANREAFYRYWLHALPGSHGDRLRTEAERLRQPFGQVRQFLNQYLAVQRADQLQRRHLAILFAGMGYPTESRRQAQAIATASSRILCEIIVRLGLGMRAAEAGRLDEATAMLPEIEDLLRRGIRCGAIVDPWNVLGFSGQFPLFQAAEDSVPDPRIEDLIRVMELIFNLYARLLGDAAATGQGHLRSRLSPRLQSLAEWWDQFGTYEVASVPRVHGQDAVDSAEHVAAALARWHDRGEATADIAFWRQHAKAFQSPKAYALVIHALLQHHDLQASMALLMNWLSQAHEIALEEGEFSFHMLALRWLMMALSQCEQRSSPSFTVEDLALVKKFFDYLEVNAEELWSAPRLPERSAASKQAMEPDQPEYPSAYEDVTYRDTAADGIEGPLAEAGPGSTTDFPLEFEHEALLKHLKFVHMVARLWLVTARCGQLHQLPPEWNAVLKDWLRWAQSFHSHLLRLLQELHALEIPAPLGSPDSMIEYDRRRTLKEQVLDTAINTALNLALVMRALSGVHRMADPPDHGPKLSQPSWEALAADLERTLLRGDRASIRELLPRFVREVSQVPLLYVPLDAGGEPKAILQARLVQTTIRFLVDGLPRIGLLRESFHLLLIARAMEQVQPPAGKRVTEFDRLFTSGLTACVESITDASHQWEHAGSDIVLVSLLELLTRPFVRLWSEHSRSLQLSVLESVSSQAEWQELKQFVKEYGNELFTVKFMTFANLRGILHRGVSEYLDYLVENDDPRSPSRLVADLDRRLARTKAVRFLEIVLHAIAENYDIYRDYNTTTPHSDFGENLHILLEFLRLRASYERQVWLHRPYVLVHEILARKGRWAATVLWQAAFAELVRRRAEQHLDELARLEAEHGIKLRTVADRLGERFTAPLAQDRLVALIEPAMRESDQGEASPSFQRLLKELQPFVENPSGVGLDLPLWLRRMETEVVRVRNSQTATSSLADRFERVPGLPLSLEDLQEQLRNWDQPLV